MTVTALSGQRWQGSASSSTSEPAQNFYKYLDSDILTGEGDTLTVDLSSPKDNLMILVHVLQDAANTTDNPDFRMRLGTGGSIDDGSGGTYPRKWSQCFGGADTDNDTTGVSKSSVDIPSDGDGWLDRYAVAFVRNASGSSKMIMCDEVDQGGTGTTADTPVGAQCTAVWENTGVCNKVEVFNVGAGDFGIDSEVVVLGYDDDEADSGDVFWKELGTYTNTTSEILQTPTFTSKRYLWIEIIGANSSSNHQAISFNTYGSTTDYNFFYQSDFGSTGDSQGRDATQYTIANTGTEWAYSVQYWCDLSGREKLGIIKTAEGTGASSQPKSSNFFGKCNNTTNITKAIVGDADGGAHLMADKSTIRVWGGEVA